MGNGKVVNIVQVQGSGYEGLKSCFKHCSCETQIYARNKGWFSEEETWKGGRIEANKLQSNKISNKW